MWWDGVDEMDEMQYARGFRLEMPADRVDEFDKMQDEKTSR